MSGMSGINNTQQQNIAASTSTGLPQGARTISSFEERLKDFDNGLKKLREKFSTNSHGSVLHGRQEETAAAGHGLSSPPNAFENPKPRNQKVIRYERGYAMLTPVDLNGRPKSFTALQGAAGPIAMNLAAGTPGGRETAMATALFKHVMAYGKDASLQTPSIDASPITIVSGKSQTLMPDLAVSLLLYAHPERSAEQKIWNWRNDKHLRLTGEQADQLATRMSYHGIDPASVRFTAAEKAAVFVLAANETFVIGSSEDNTVKINGSIPNAT
ncbi:MAG TPA: hypothetical protein VF427_11105 [Noviherbaspirillum sp.]